MAGCRDGRGSRRWKAGLAGGASDTQDATARGHAILRGEGLRVVMRIGMFVGGCGLLLEGVVAVGMMAVVFACDHVGPREGTCISAVAGRRLSGRHLAGVGAAIGVSDDIWKCNGMTTRPRIVSKPTDTPKAKKKYRGQRTVRRKCKLTQCTAV